MKLSSAAKHFDRLVCADAYAPSTTFLGQFNLFDDSTRDGLTVARRILSTAPSVTMPARRTILAGGRVWMVGDQIPDYFGNAEIRNKYPVQESDGLATLKTIAQVLAGSTGSTAHTSLIWVKGTKEVEVSSGIYDVMNAYFTAAESVPERTLININSRWYLVRTIFTTSAGFQSAVVDELPEPVLEVATFSGRTYNPITDTYSKLDVSVTVLRVRWQSAFEYLTIASEKYERGDMQVMAPKTTTPKVQDLIVMSDGKWQVLSIIDEGTYWSLHVRRA